MPEKIGKIELADLDQQLGFGVDATGTGAGEESQIEPGTSPTNLSGGETTASEGSLLGSNQVKLTLEEQSQFDSILSLLNLPSNLPNDATIAARLKNSPQVVTEHVIAYLALKQKWNTLETLILTKLDDEQCQVIVTALAKHGQWSRLENLCKYGSKDKSSEYLISPQLMCVSALAQARRKKELVEVKNGSYFQAVKDAVDAALKELTTDETIPSVTESVEKNAQGSQARVEMSPETPYQQALVKLTEFFSVTAEDEEPVDPARVQQVAEVFVEAIPSEKLALIASDELDEVTFEQLGINDKSFGTTIESILKLLSEPGRVYFDDSQGIDDLAGLRNWLHSKNLLLTIGQYQELLRNNAFASLQAFFQENDAERSGVASIVRVLVETIQKAAASNHPQLFYSLAQICNGQSEGSLDQVFLEEIGITTGVLSQFASRLTEQYPNHASLRFTYTSQATFGDLRQAFVTQGFFDAQEDSEKPSEENNEGAGEIAEPEHDASPRPEVELTIDEAKTRFIELLGRTTDLRELNPEDAAGLESIIKVVEYEQGRRICNAGDPPSDLIFVAAGEVRDYRTSQQIPIGTGLFENGLAPIPMSAVAVTKVTCLRVKSSDLGAYIESVKQSARQEQVEPTAAPEHLDTAQPEEKDSSLLSVLDLEEDAFPSVIKPKPQTSPPPAGNEEKDGDPGEQLPVFDLSEDGAAFKAALNTTEPSEEHFATLLALYNQNRLQSLKRLATEAKVSAVREKAGEYVGRLEKQSKPQKGRDYLKSVQRAVAGFLRRAVGDNRVERDLDKEAEAAPTEEHAPAPAQQSEQAEPAEKQKRTSGVALTTAEAPTPMFDSRAKKKADEKFEQFNFDALKSFGTEVTRDNDGKIISEKPRLISQGNAAADVTKAEESSQPESGTTPRKTHRTIIGEGGMAAAVSLRGLSELDQSGLDQPYLMGSPSMLSRAASALSETLHPRWIKKEIQTETISALQEIEDILREPKKYGLDTTEGKAEAWGVVEEAFAEIARTREGQVGPVTERVAAQLTALMDEGVLPPAGETDSSVSFAAALQQLQGFYDNYKGSKTVDCKIARKSLFTFWVSVKDAPLSDDDVEALEQVKKRNSLLAFAVGYWAQAGWLTPEKVE